VRPISHAASSASAAIIHIIHASFFTKYNIAAAVARPHHITYRWAPRRLFWPCCPLFSFRPLGSSGADLWRLRLHLREPLPMKCASRAVTSSLYNGAFDAHRSPYHTLCTAASAFLQSLHFAFSPPVLTDLPMPPCDRDLDQSTRSAVCLCCSLAAAGVACRSMNERYIQGKHE
jgi:hypothetical protein